MVIQLIVLIIFLLQAKAALGHFKEAEEIFLMVQNEKLHNDYVYISHLARCCKIQIIHHLKEIYLAAVLRNNFFKKKKFINSMIIKTVTIWLPSLKSESFLTYWNVKLRDTKLVLIPRLTLDLHKGLCLIRKF